MCADTTIPAQPVGHHAQGQPEPSSVATKSLAAIGVGALVFLAAALTVLGTIYSGVPVKSIPAPREFPAPRVATDEHDTLANAIATQQQTLKGYGWANDQHTLVHIPIARAMGLIAAKGQKAYDPVAALPDALAAPDAAAQRAVTSPGSAQ